MSSTLWTYNQIIQRLEVFADGHYFIASFTHGQIDVKNLEKFPTYPHMHVIPEGFDYAPQEKTFNFRVLIFDKPRQVEEKPDYQKEVISDTQQVIEDLVYELKNGRTLFGKEVDTPESFSITAFMESYENVVTGCEAVISITVPNQWSACNIPANWALSGSGSTTSPAYGGLVLRTDGVNNAVQNILDLVEGSNITLTDLGDGRVRIAATGGGGGGLTCNDLAACQTIIDILADIEDNARDITTVTNALTAHINNTSNPHATTKAQVGLGNVDNTSDANKPVSTAQATAIAAVQTDIDTHEANTSNPHSVTKSQVGLANVDDTADADKPVSTAQAAADAAVGTAAATDATTKANAAQAAAIAASQPLDSDLTAIASIAPANDDVIQRKAGAWTNRTLLQYGTDLDGGMLVGTPAATGFSVKTEDILRYNRPAGSKICNLIIRIVGTSNATTFTFTLPFPAANTHIQRVSGNIQNNTTNAVAYFSTTINSTTATVTTATGGSFTASGTKALTCNGIYETT